MMYCERCNAEFSEAMTYCKWCGQTLVERRPANAEVLKCKSCSTPIQEGWTFCNSCGAKAPAAQESDSPLCLQCGAVVTPGAATCLRCGHRLPSERGAKPSSGGVQYCLTCGDTMETGKLYCKTCGAPVYNTSTNIKSPFAPQEEPASAPPSLQQTSPSGSSSGGKENPATLPAETVNETFILESPEAPDLPGAPAKQSNPRTEVYQSFKPESASTDPGVTIDFRKGKTPAPSDAEVAKKDSPRNQGKTIEYGAFNLLKNQAETPSSAESEDDRATMQILSAGDLQAEPEVFDPYATVQGTLLDFPLDASLETPPAARDGEHKFEITPAEEPVDKFSRAPINQQAKPVSVDPNAGRNEAERPIVESGTMHLEMDALPFESTVKEDTGPLTPNRPTTKLSGVESAQRSANTLKAGQETTDRIDAAETGPVPQEPITLPSPERLTVVSQPVSAQPPAKPEAAPWQANQPAVAPWPQNQPGVAQPDAKKKGGAPVALIAAAVLAIAVAAAVIWWFVLRSPNTDVVSPNTNTRVITNANTGTTNTSATPEGMVMVAAGDYIIGRDDGDGIEKPRHKVALKAFFIDKTEVTNAEYKKFIDAINHKAPAHWKDRAFPEGQANFPVVQVTWQDANDYAKWAGKRLPTEVEWEAAARGATGRKYPWGNQWNQSFANIGAGEAGSIVEVGKYPEGQSPFGALDMIGNVWEWTADVLTVYPGSSLPLPDMVDATKSYRVIRGGAYDVMREKVNLDNSYRGFVEEDKAYPKTGFRCVKDAQ
jgi:formylglycine-generating enzyme required for sulfatase activity